MTDLIAAAQQALEALEEINRRSISREHAQLISENAIEALRERLAQPEQEPVKFWPLAPLTGYYDVGGKRVWLEKDEPFPAPPQRKPLTDEEMRECFTSTNTCEPLDEGWQGLERFARAIERAHGIVETK